MARVAATFGGVIVLALLAAGLTEATLAFGQHGSLSNDAQLRPVKASPSPTPTNTPAPSPTPLATPEPTATPAPTPAVPTATTNGFVHMRSGASIYAPIVIDLNAGSVVELLPYSDAQWQQVRYNGSTGYIFKSYLTY